MDDLVRDLSILGVDAAASPTQVHERYLELVRRWHPDRFAGDPQGQAEATIRMRQIDDAYRRVTARQSWARASASCAAAPIPTRLPRETVERMVASLGTESVVDWFLRGVDRLFPLLGGDVRRREPPEWIQVANRMSARLAMAALIAYGVWLIVAASLTHVDYFVTDARGHPADPLVNPVFQGITGAVAFIAFLFLLWAFTNK